MEPLWWSHLAAPLCISSLLSVNYTWFTRCLRQRGCGASIWERVITPRERVAVGGGGGEGQGGMKVAGYIIQPTWQDVLQLSLVELDWAIALIALIRDDLCQVCRESRREWRAQEGAFIPEPLCFLYRWGSSLTIPPPFQKPVDTDGLYSPRALYENHKACRGALQGLCLHGLMNRVHYGIFLRACVTRGLIKSRCDGRGPLSRGAQKVAQSSPRSHYELGSL